MREVWWRIHHTGEILGAFATESRGRGCRQGVAVLAGEAGSRVEMS